MTRYPERTINEIGNQRTSFPDVARVDEVWIIETIGYGTTFFGTHLRFELYKDGTVVKSFDFNDGELMA